MLALGNMKTESEIYAVTDRPGYFGAKARIYSTHRTLEVARRQMRRSGYIDEHGKLRFPCCIVAVDGSYYRKGGTLWGDMFPTVLE